ncbi:hypothetical protein B0T20DRAFT_494987 [Sordaria brevicollis]|uniref:Uncharacterized protein n=1 Tax=Sordaria brevicollis TaxID=83679 RepID=A0AAE0UEH9_SORBR|nr:hypothetical protein B0T20DRAFT_494987 [Sordaria brevicollis]
MVLDRCFGQGSDPYEYLGDWAERFTVTDDGKPKGASQEAEDSSESRAGDEDLIGGISEYDRKEGIIDIYLDIRLEQQQSTVSDPYQELDRWAERLGQDQNRGANCSPEEREEDQGAGLPGSCAEQTRRDVHNPGDNDGNKWSDNSNDNEIILKNSGNEESKNEEKQPCCHHKSVIPRLVRSFFSRAASCGCGQESASVSASTLQSQPCTAQPASTDRDRSSHVTPTPNSGKSDQKTKRKDTITETQPTISIRDDWYEVPRHPGMYALRMLALRSRALSVSVDELVDASTCAAAPTVRPNMKKELGPDEGESEDWDTLSDMSFDAPDLKDLHGTRRRGEWWMSIGWARQGERGVDMVLQQKGGEEWRNEGHGREPLSGQEGEEARIGSLNTSQVPSHLGSMASSVSAAHRHRQPDRPSSGP